MPNYQDVTINGTLTGNSFDHYKHGVLAFRVAGALSGAGVISMDSRGFQGDGSPANITGYGRGGNPTYPMKGNGGGAGHATNGKDGGSQEKDGDGGSTYGNPQLNSIFFGSGGGQSYTTTADVEYPGGGYGGGILFIMGQSINFQGNLSVKGQDRPTTIDCGLKGGAGSGGSIRVEGHDVTLNSINVQGGSPYDTYGYGGLGRVAVYYENSFSGNFTPGYLQKLDQPDTIFNSDFESGDLNQWTSAATDNGDLSASDSADYWGRYGLRALIDDTNALYVSDDSPASETRYRTRFYVDPNSLSMGAGEILDLLAGYNGATQVLRVQMQKVSGTYQLRAGLLSDAGSWTDTSWYAIQDAWTAVEIDWQALAYDGSLSLYVGGAFKQSLTRIDNDTRKLGSVRLGAMGVDAGTSGALYFDDFESRRYSYIGLLLDPGVDDPEPGTPGQEWFSADYAYDGAQPHAVTEVTRASSTDTYDYDENGNMTCRVENGDWFEQSYNAEKRISAITKRDGSCEGTLIASWSYAYDGDGTRVTTLYDDGSTQTLTRYYFGGAYEETGGAVRKYYSLAGQTVAMRDAEGLKYFLTDHLGSTLAVLDANGNVLSEQRYPSTGSGQVCLSAPCAMTWARSRRPTLATPPRETCPRPA